MREWVHPSWSCQKSMIFFLQWWFFITKNYPFYSAPWSKGIVQISPLNIGVEVRCFLVKQVAKLSISHVCHQVPSLSCLPLHYTWDVPLYMRPSPPPTSTPSNTNTNTNTTITSTPTSNTNTTSTNILWDHQFGECTHLCEYWKRDNDLWSSLLP